MRLCTKWTLFLPLSLALALGCAKKKGDDSSGEEAPPPADEDTDDVTPDDDDEEQSALYEPTTTPDSIAPQLPGALALEPPAGGLRLADGAGSGEPAKDDGDLGTVGEDVDGKAEASSSSSEGLGRITDRFGYLRDTIVDLNLSMYILDSIATAELKKCKDKLPCPAEPATVKGAITKEMVNKAIADGGEGFPNGAAFKERIGEKVVFKDFQVRDLPKDESGLDHDVRCLDMKVTDSSSLEKSTDAVGLRLAARASARGLSLADTDDTAVSDDGSIGDSSYTDTNVATYCWDADKKHVYTYNNITSTWSYTDKEGKPIVDTSTYDQYFAYELDAKGGNDLYFSNNAEWSDGKYEDELGLHQDPKKSKTNGASIFLKDSYSGNSYGRSSTEVYGFADDVGLYLETTYTWPTTEVVSATINVGAAALAADSYLLTPVSDLGADVEAETVWNIAQGSLYLPEEVAADRALTTADFDKGEAEAIGLYWQGTGATAPATLELWTESFDDDGKVTISKTDAVVEDLVFTQTDSVFYYYEEYSVKDGALKPVYYCSKDTLDGECIGEAIGEKGDYGDYYGKKGDDYVPSTLQVILPDNTPALLQRNYAVLIRNTDKDGNATPDFTGVNPFGKSNWSDYQVGDIWYGAKDDQPIGDDTAADYYADIWDESAIGDFTIYAEVPGDLPDTFVFAKVEGLELTAAYVDAVPDEEPVPKD